MSKQIFNTLASYGRLTIAQLYHHTQIPTRRLKPAITLLTQHHIILHYAADEDEPTYFSVNWEAAYVLVRPRKIARLVEDRYGEAAGNMIETVMQIGHVSVGDLAAEYSLESGSKRDSGIDTVEQHMTEEGMLNGIAKNIEQQKPQAHITAVTQYHDTLRSLLDAGFLTKVGARALTAASDLQEQLENVVIAEQFADGRVTGPKKAKLFEAAVTTLKRKWHDEDEYAPHRDIGSQGTIKRGKASSSQGNKRVKISDNLPNGIHDSALELNDDEDMAVKRPVRKLPVLCCPTKPSHEALG